MYAGQLADYYDYDDDIEVEVALFQLTHHSSNYACHYHHISSARPSDLATEQPSNQATEPPSDQASNATSQSKLAQCQSAIYLPFIYSGAGAVVR